MVSYRPMDCACIKEKFEGLGGRQRYLLELWYNKEKKLFLSNRSANALKDWTLIDFYTQVLINDGFSFRSISQIENRSIEELECFKGKIENLVIDLSAYDANRVEREILNVKYGRLGADSFVRDFYEANQYLPMFGMLQKKLRGELDPEISVFNRLMPLFVDSNVESLEGVSAELKFNKRKIRRMCITAFQKIFTEKNPLFRFNEDWEVYRSCLEGEVISIGSPELSEINKSEKTNFSAVCILQVLALVFASEMKLIGGDDWEKYELTGWKSVYLVHSRVADVYDLYKFKRVIKQKITADNGEDELFNLDDYLQEPDCWNTYDLEIIDETRSVLLVILMEEFNLYPDLDGNIVIKGNKIYPPEVIYKILKETGRRMHIQEVFEKYNKKYPNKFEYTNKLWPHITKSDKIIICDSEYLVLKEWETKTKTILDLIIEFLNKKDIPQSEREVRDYLPIRVADFTMKDLRYSIKQGKERKKLVIFENNLIGLEDKDYPTYYVKPLPNQEIFKAMRNRFEYFIHSNGYWPSISSKEVDEQELGRWWNNISNKELSIDQQKEIQQLKEQQQLCYKDKRESQWYKKFYELRDFISQNKGLPRDISSEKELLKVWKRLKKDNAENRLNEKLKKEYRDLCKLL